MIYFDSADLYIEKASTLRDKILRVNAIIDALETQALKAAANENITEYSLNDGQTTIRTVYRSSAEVERSINAFERIKQRYINQLNSRGMRLMDSKNINNGRI